MINCLQIILFTTDETILELISLNDETFKDATCGKCNDTEKETGRPITATKNYNVRPNQLLDNTNISSVYSFAQESQKNHQRSIKPLQNTSNDELSLACTQIELIIISTWSSSHLIGEFKYDFCEC